MVVNHKYKFCFVQNPKCASTYVADCLAKLSKSTVTQHKHNQSYAFLRKKSYGGEPLNHDEYKIFTTIRNPYDLYPSLWAYSRVVPTSHIGKFFPYEEFDDFLNAAVRLQPSPWKEGAFQRYFGCPIDTLAQEDYGWATFSAIYWTSRGRPKWKSLKANRLIQVFPIEQQFQSRISRYLGIGEKIWKAEKTNRTPHSIELTKAQRLLIYERDRQVFERFYE